MKKLFICITIGLFSSAIFAAEPPINCDELAQHIKNELDNITLTMRRNPLGVTVSKSGHYMVSFFVHSSCKESYKQKECKAAGLERDPNAIKDLPGKIDFFRRYHNALAKCTQSSKTACPLASQTMQELQEKMNACSQCIAEYNEGYEETTKKNAEESKQRAAMQKFIHDANQEK